MYVLVLKCIRNLIDEHLPLVRVAAFEKLLIDFHYANDDVFLVGSLLTNILHCVVKAVSVDIDGSVETCDLILRQSVAREALIV